jgi:hypothetical protein
VSQESLDESPGTSVLLHEGPVLETELIAFIVLHCDLAFELADVF